MKHNRLRKAIREKSKHIPYEIDDGALLAYNVYAKANNNLSQYQDYPIFPTLLITVLQTIGQYQD